MRINWLFRVSVVGFFAVSVMIVLVTGTRRTETRGIRASVGSVIGEPQPSDLVIEGFAGNTIGGTRGTLYLVTNLNDSGPCSLRDFLNRRGPRIIKFGVSGTIHLRSDLKLTEPFITIDGSDAPDGGIAIRGASFLITASQVIVRHVRFREGDLGTTSSDAVYIGGDDGRRPSDVVLDHCSISWGDDGNLDIVNGATGVTIQWCIISENLGPGATLISYGATRITLHHNLYVNSGSNRNPAVVGGQVDLVNNVVYRNSSARPFDNLNGVGPGPTLPVHINIVGNLWKAGSDENTTNPHDRAIYLYGGEALSSQSGVYLQGNIGPSRPNDSLLETQIAYQNDGPFPISSSRYSYPEVTTTTAQQAYMDVLANAGATLPCRDAVDKRIIKEVTRGSGEQAAGPFDWPDLTPPCGDNR